MTSVLGRLDAVDAGTAADRTRDRHRRIAVATVAGAGSRAFTAVTLVVALPLAATHLDRQELGVWTLLVTAVALLGFADLGIGNGLLTVLSDAVGRDDRAHARRTVSAAAFGLLGVAGIGGLAAALLVPRAPWAALLHVDPARVPQLHLAVGVFAACVVVAIPASVGQRIHMAYQQSWAASATGGAGSVLALVAVVAAASAGASLPWFVAAMLVPPVLAAAAETGWVLLGSHRDLAPRRVDVDRVVLRSLLRSGGLFFVLALAGAVAYQSDTLVISHALGGAAVTRYGVALRLFTLAPTALMAFLLPLWPAYGEALARHDVAWVRATLRRSLAAAAGVSAVASAALLLLAPPLLRAWAPEVPASPFGLLLALAVWAVVSSCSVALAMYFNGANVVRLQVVLAIAMATTNLALSLVLVEHIGVAGPVWASVITQTVVVLIPELWILRSMLERRLAPARVAGALSRAHVREVAGRNRTLVRRGLSAVRKARLRAGDPTVPFDLDGTTLLLPLSHDLPVHRAVHPTYSENLADVVEAVVAVRPTATVVDIGANVGDSVAIVRARVAVPILCIEGDELFLPYLRRNVAHVPDVELAPVYVATSGSATGRAVVERAGGTARLVDRSAAAEATDDQPGVTVSQLADVLVAHPRFGRPTVLKVDTDGNDATILRAARAVLADAHPVLFFEHDPTMALAVGAPEPTPFFRELIELGYDSFIVFANTGETLGCWRAHEVADLEARSHALDPTGPTPYLDVCAVHRADLDLQAVLQARFRRG